MGVRSGILDNDRLPITVLLLMMSVPFDVCRWVDLGVDQVRSPSVRNHSGGVRS